MFLVAYFNSNCTYLQSISQTQEGESVVSIYCRKKIIGDPPTFLIVKDLLYSLRPQKCLISFLEDKKKPWEALHPIPAAHVDQAFLRPAHRSGTQSIGKHMAYMPSALQPT